LPEIEPVLLTIPLPANDMPLPVTAADTTPAFEIVQVVPAPPSMPSAVPAEVTVPVPVMYRGLSVAGARTTGPVTLLLIVVDIGSTQLFESNVVDTINPRRSQAVR
jgi:hypothetical protein